MGSHIGLIGCGRWGAFILRDLRELDCRVTVVARSGASCQRALAGGGAVVPSIAELPSVDGIVVATTTPTHAEVVLSVLNRGVPIFVEKPLSDSAADAALVEARGKGLVFVMDKWRYHPGVCELARIARSHELGPVVGLRTLRLGWGNPHDDADSVWVLAPHDLAIGLEVLGELLPARSALAENANGEPAGLFAHCGDSPWHAFEVSTRRLTEQRSALLLCRDGTAELTDSYAKHVTITRGKSGRDKTLPEPERRALPDDMPLLSELEAFVQHLDGGPPPKSNAHEGAAMVRVLTDLRRMAGLPA